MVQGGLPVILKVTGQRCLVVGGGPVGVRKAQQLAQAGAEVTLLSRNLRVAAPGIRFERGLYTTTYAWAFRPWLMVAATNDRAINHQIAQDAAALNILSMVEDKPEEASVQAVMQREFEGIRLMATTGSPLLTRLVLERASANVTPGLVQFGAWLRALRTASRSLISEQAERAALWAAIMDSDVLTLLEAGRQAEAAALLQGLVGPELADYVDFP